MPFFIIDFVAKISYELMWLFSYAEIMVIRAYNQTILPIKESEFFKSMQESFAGESEPILFVKDGNIIQKSTRRDSTLFKEEYDFIVDTTLPHYVIHKSVPNDFNDYIVSSVDFILTELYIGADKLQIKFVNKAQGYTYAIVNNVIDATFLMYFMKNHYYDQFCVKFNIPISQLMEGYSLKIIDNNVNIVTIDEKQSLRFSKDSYNIEMVGK